MFTFTLSVLFSPPTTLTLLALVSFAAFAVVWADMRIRRVRNFRTDLKIHFLTKVLGDPSLCEDCAEVQKLLFFERLPGTARLFFSHRPLYPEYWFRPIELDLFFYPNLNTVCHAAI